MHRVADERVVAAIAVYKRPSMGLARARIPKALAALCAAWSLTHAALAAPPAAPALRPPVLTGKPEVPYPDGAHGNRAVVLELVIDVEGSVTDARVVTGDEPFASAALAHARELHFTPATRNGTPVAARIRVELRFREPQPETAPATSPPAVESAPAPRPSVQPRAIEVVVTGDPIEEKTVMSGAEVRQLPGAFGDAFRAIEALPGVTPIFSGVPFFYVRGAPPGNVGYFLDGIRVPLLYHLALGPSVINPALVDRVELFPGAYPARYGRYAGGIVAAETTPPRYEVHGEGNVRVFDTGALVEAPFADRRGAALLGGRYSYTGAVVSLLAPEVTLRYWDYQGRIAYQLTPKDTVSLFAFGSYDFFGQSNDPSSSLGAQFHRVDLRWDRSVSPQTQVRLAATLGSDETLAGQDEFDIRDRSVRARTELAHRVDSNTSVHAGADVGLDDYAVIYRPHVSGVAEATPEPVPNQPSPSPTPTPPPPQTNSGTSDQNRVEQLLPPRQDVASGVWAELAWRAAPRVQVTPGVRVDYYLISHATAFAVEPRVSAKYELTPTVRVNHALGLASQPPSFIVPIPGFSMSGLANGLQRSLQASSGVEVDLPARFTGSLTFFDNIFLDMTDFLSRIEHGAGGDFQSRSLGSGIGMEILIRRPLTERLGGFISYTLSRSTRSAGRQHYLSEFDRTHVLNFALGYDLGRRWRAGTRLMYYSGYPAEWRTSAIWRNGIYTEVSEFRRTSPFYRIDLRLEKQWPLGKTGHWAFVLEFLNATLNEEVAGVDCSPSGVVPMQGSVSFKCTEQKIGPVSIPSIGVEASF